LFLLLVALGVCARTCAEKLLLVVYGDAAGTGCVVCRLLKAVCERITPVLTQAQPQSALLNSFVSQILLACVFRPIMHYTLPENLNPLCVPALLSAVRQTPIGTCAGSTPQPGPEPLQLVAAAAQSRAAQTSEKERTLAAALNEPAFLRWQQHIPLELPAESAPFGRLPPPEAQPPTRSSLLAAGSTPAKQRSTPRHMATASTALRSRQASIRFSEVGTDCSLHVQNLSQRMLPGKQDVPVATGGSQRGAPMQHSEPGKRRGTTGGGGDSAIEVAGLSAAGTMDCKEEVRFLEQTISGHCKTDKTHSVRATDMQGRIVGETPCWDCAKMGATTFKSGEAVTEQHGTGNQGEEGEQALESMHWSARLASGALLDMYKTLTTSSSDLVESSRQVIEALSGSEGAARWSSGAIARASSGSAATACPAPPLPTKPAAGALSAVPEHVRKGDSAALSFESEGVSSESGIDEMPDDDSAVSAADTFTRVHGELTGRVLHLGAEHFDSLYLGVLGTAAEGAGDGDNGTRSMLKKSLRLRRSIVPAWDVAVRQSVLDVRRIVLPCVLVLCREPACDP
jgi:hypothetical protein